MPANGRWDLTWHLKGRVYRLLYVLPGVTLQNSTLWLHCIYILYGCQNKQ